jgi:hypothetical protein
MRRQIDFAHISPNSVMPIERIKESTIPQRTSPLKEAIRWAAIVFFAGLGLACNAWLIWETIRIFTSIPVSSARWMLSVFILLLGLPIAGLPLLVSYLIWLRDYRSAAPVFYIVGSLVFGWVVHRCEHQFYIDVHFPELSGYLPIVAAICCFHGFDRWTNRFFDKRGRLCAPPWRKRAT